MKYNSNNASGTFYYFEMAVFSARRWLWQAMCELPFHSDQELGKRLIDQAKVSVDNSLAALDGAYTAFSPRKL